MAHDFRLRPVGSMKQLQTTVKAAISDPATAFAPRVVRLPDLASGLPNVCVSKSSLAVAMYDALYSGISIRGILTVIKTEYDHAPHERRITPATLGRVLLDFQQLIQVPPEEGPVASEANLKRLAAYSELVWLLCHRDIIDRHVLGESFGKEFARETAQALRGRMQHYDRMAKTFPDEPGVLKRRDRAASGHFDHWLDNLVKQIEGIDSGLLPRSARQPEAGMRALPPGTSR